MIIKLEFNPDSGNMRITSKPRGDIGNIRIVKPAPQEIIDQLDGRTQAYFYAISMAGNLTIYTEIKPFTIW